jgi:hypothetical protein
MRKVNLVLGSAALVVVAGLTARAGEAERKFTDTFPVDASEWSSTGTNPWFVLEPGYVLELAGTEEGKPARLVITVLDETKTVDGVETRVVEERETVGGELEEVSRNYFAISKRTNSVYYFGEDVDEYDDGKVAGHPGAWLSGANGAKFGLFMPGDALLGARYFQEVAPGVAMDRAEVLSVSETLETPAAKFEHCLRAARKGRRAQDLCPRRRRHPGRVSAPGQARSCGEVSAA